MRRVGFAAAGLLAIVVLFQLFGRYSYMSVGYTVVRVDHLSNTTCVSLPLDRCNGAKPPTPVPAPTDALSKYEQPAASNPEPGPTRTSAVDAFREELDRERAGRTSPAPGATPYDGPRPTKKCSPSAEYLAEYLNDVASRQQCGLP
jgi:hypothetical protein